MPIVYRMDRVTGRIVGASSRVGYNPQAFAAVEAIPIMKASATERVAPVRGVADLRTPVQQQMTIPQTEIHGKYPDTAGYRRLQEWQRIMSKQDGKLIWQKLPRDITMYKATVVLCAVGLGLFVSNMYQMIYKESSD